MEVFLSGLGRGNRAESRVRVVEVYWASEITPAEVGRVVGRADKMREIKTKRTAPRAASRLWIDAMIA